MVNNILKLHLLSADLDGMKEIPSYVQELKEEHIELYKRVTEELKCVHFSHISSYFRPIAMLKLIYLFECIELGTNDFFDAYISIIVKDAQLSYDTYHSSTKNKAFKDAEAQRFFALESMALDADKVVNFIQLRLANKSLSFIGKALNLKAVEVKALVLGIGKLYKIA